jgi:nucleoside-diphosphate-sugar epimerase
VSRVLITGGAGFMGLHLGRNLQARGHGVDLLDNFSRGSRDADLEELASRPGVRLIAADLLSPDGLDLGRDYDLIFHLAAIIGVANVEARPLAVLRDNQRMMFAALELAAGQKALSRFVFASTSEVYAGTLEHFDLPVPTPESARLALPDLARKRSTYMLSKIYGEALCHQSGLPFTILRPHNIYGPRMGMAHVIPELLARASSASDGGVLPVFSVDQTRTFCFVDDAVEMMARAALAPGCAGEVLNIGAAGPELTIGELARQVVAATGRRLTIEPRPAPPGSPARRCPDMSKTTRLTGYEARTPLAEGIARTHSWYLDQGLLGGRS